MHAQLSHHDRPRRLLNVSVRSRLGKPCLGGDLYHLPAIIIPQHCLRRVARAHIQLPCHAFIKTTISKQLFLWRRTRSLKLGGRQWWGVGTVGRGLATLAWMLPRYNT